MPSFSMRVAFAGSAEVSAELLEALYLAPGVKIVGVITQPDRPFGRKQHITPCPCKKRALALGLESIIATPEKINTPESIAHLASLKPDILVVVAYGQFLGTKLLNLPPLGCLNIHFSLLPLLRGAAPVQWAVANGFTRTGVTAMFMNEGMDSGDILDTIETQIASDETSTSLFPRLTEMGASLLLRVLPAVGLGMFRRAPQNHTDATFAPKLKKIDGKINWITQSAVEIERRIRAFNPWPGCFTDYDTIKFKTKIFKIFKAAVISNPAYEEFKPGQICDVLPDGLVIKCREDGLQLLSIQSEGKPVRTGVEFRHGRNDLKAYSWLSMKCEEEQ